MADSLFCAERPSPPGPAPEWAKDGTDWLYPHVASPDVHVDRERQQIRMYLHGLLPDGEQMTRVALSQDGLTFEVRPALLGPAYFRVFRHGGWHYALAHPNLILRSRDGLGVFEPGPSPLDPATRHTAVCVRGDILHLFWTRIGDRPERIYHAALALTGRGHWRRPQLVARIAGLARRAGRVEELAEEWRDRLEAEPGDLATREALCDLLIAEGHGAEAARLLEEALADHPADLGLARARCDLLERMGQGEALLGENG